MLFSELPGQTMIAAQLPLALAATLDVRLSPTFYLLPSSCYLHLTRASLSLSLSLAVSDCHCLPAQGTRPSFLSFASTLLRWGFSDLYQATAVIYDSHAGAVFLAMLEGMETAERQRLHVSGEDLMENKRMLARKRPQLRQMKLQEMEEFEADVREALAELSVVPPPGGEGSGRVVGVDMSAAGEQNIHMNDLLWALVHAGVRQLIVVHASPLRSTLFKQAAAEEAGEECGLLEPRNWWAETAQWALATASVREALIHPAFHRRLVLGYERHLGGYAGPQLEKTVPREDRRGAGIRLLWERFGWVPGSDEGYASSARRAAVVARVEQFERCGIRELVSDYGGLSAALGVQDWYQLLLEGSSNLYTAKIGTGHMFELCGGSRSEVPLWETLRHDMNTNLVAAPSLAFGKGKGRETLLNELLFPCDKGRREPVPKLQFEAAEIQKKREGGHLGDGDGKEDLPWDIRRLYSPRLVDSALFDEAL